MKKLLHFNWLIMRTILLILLIFINHLNGLSQDANSDKELYGLRGQVESVYAITYYASYDSLGNVKKGDLYDDAQQRNFFFSKMFNSFRFYTPENSICVFDKKGNAKTILYFRKRPMVLYMAEIRSFSNDSMFNETVYVGDGITFNFITTIAKKLAVKKRLIRKDYDQIDTITTTYNYKQNLLTKEEMFQNSELQGAVYYEYDHHKRISQKYYMGNGSKDTLVTWFYVYNNNGYVETEIEKSKDKTITRKFEYKYDSKGNWTECYKFVNSTLDALVERKIKYF